MNFENKYDESPEWQKERFKRMLEAIEIELTDKEKSYLLWLSGWDAETETVFTGLMKKLKEHK